MSHWYQFNGSFSCSHLQERAFLLRLQLTMLSNCSTFSTSYRFFSQNPHFHLSFLLCLNIQVFSQNRNKKTPLSRLLLLCTARQDCSCFLICFLCHNQNKNQYPQGSVSSILIHYRDCQCSGLGKSSSSLFCPRIKMKHSFSTCSMFPCNWLICF